MDHAAHAYYATLRMGDRSGDPPGQGPNTKETPETLSRVKNYRCTSIRDAMRSQLSRWVANTVGPLLLALRKKRTPGGKPNTNKRRNKLSYIF